MSSSQSFAKPQNWELIGRESHRGMQRFRTETSRIASATSLDGNIANALRIDRQLAFFPAPESAVHRNDIGVSHAG